MKFDAIGFAVADMDASLAFYERLGLEVVMPPDDDKMHAELGLPGGLRLMLDSHDTIKMFDPDFEPLPFDAPRGSSVAFLCDDPAAVDAKYAELTAAGYHGHKEPWDAFWGQRYAVVKDPDGNTVDLFAGLPAA